MDAVQFDTLAIHVARLTRRRTLAHLVLALPALAALLIGGGPGTAAVEAADAPSRFLRRRTRRRRRRRRKHPGRRHKHHRKRKPTRRCTPRTCPANGCGTMTDGCGGTLRCGCGVNQLCVDGTCRTCDVCQPAGACVFDSVQEAIEAIPPLETIVVCPGTYVEDVDSATAIRIERSLRLVGAGDGDDPATNTILRPKTHDRFVVNVRGHEETPHVTLERVQITGAIGLNGVGLVVRDAAVDLIGCTITHNVTTGSQPGGVLADKAQLTLTDTRITGNFGGVAGGMFVQPGSQVTFDTLSRVKRNHATQDRGGIYAQSGSSVELPSMDNVTGNTNNGGDPNCGGSGTFIGPGAICLTT